MALLAKVSDVEARLEDDVTDKMRTMIEASIEDASDWACFYGRREWTELDCPLPVSRMVAVAVARFMRNPERLNQSRAGDETLTFQESPVDWYSDQEIERLGRIGNPVVASFGTIQVTGYGAKPRAAVQHALWGGASNRPFPFVEGGG